MNLVPEVFEYVVDQAKTIPYDTLPFYLKSQGLSYDIIRHVMGNESDIVVQIYRYAVPIIESHVLRFTYVICYRCSSYTVFVICQGPKTKYINKGCQGKAVDLVLSNGVFTEECKNVDWDPMFDFCVLDNKLRLFYKACNDIPVTKNKCGKLNFDSMLVTFRVVLGDHNKPDYTTVSRWVLEDHAILSKL